MDRPSAPRSASSRDREHETTRIVDAARDDVLAAIVDPARLARWWGPRGFTSTFERCDVRAGGEWKFTLHAPDGANHANESRFVEVGPDRIVIEHVSPPRFVLVISLRDQGSRTLVGWRQTFEDVATFRALAPLVTVANEQNLDRLVAEIERVERPHG